MIATFYMPTGPITVCTICGAVMVEGLCHSCGSTKGTMKHEIRIIIRCTEHEDHAKILRLDPSVGMEYPWELAQLLDGTSRFYIHKPGGQDDVHEWPGGKGSPIGRCTICGARFTCTVTEIGGDNDEERNTNSNAPAGS